MRIRGGKRLVHGDAAGEPECELGAVDAVVAAVDQADRDIHHLEAQGAFRHRFPDSLFDCRNPLPRHRTAVDFLFELEALAARQGADLNDYVAELAVATGLFLVAAVLTHRLADRFTISDRGGMTLHLHAVA